MTRRSTIESMFLIAAVIALMAPLSGYALAGTHSRYLSDDFCTAGSLRAEGFWRSQMDWYQNWSGRFSFTFLVQVAHLIGPGLVPLVPAALLLLLLLALYAFWRMFAPEAKGRLTALAIAAAVGLFVVGGAPGIYQPLLWLTGALTYVVPLILLTALLVILTLNGERGRPRGPLALPGMAALAFFAGGFSETYVVIQSAILGALFAAAVFRVGRLNLAPKTVLVVLAASVAAGLIVYVAPGNEVRLSVLPDPRPWEVVLKLSIRDVVIFANRVLRSETLLLAAVMGVPLILGALRSEGDRPKRLSDTLSALVALPAVTYFLMALTFAPSEYVISSYPDTRVLITTQFIFGLGLALWSWLLGTGLNRLGERMKLARFWDRALWVAVGLACALSIAAAGAELSDTALLLQDVEAFSQTWDERDANIRRAMSEGIRELSARSLTHMDGLAELDRDPETWINRCIAQYYGLDSVVAK